MSKSFLDTIRPFEGMFADLEDDDGIDHLPMEEQLELLFGEADREVRLAQILAEFEEVRTDYAARINPRYLADKILRLQPEDVCFYTASSGTEHRIGQAARRYIVGRDFNEFHPERADMIWKLQRQ